MVRGGFRTCYILVDGTVGLGICAVAYAPLWMEELANAFISVGFAVAGLSFLPHTVDFRDDHDACPILSHADDDANANVADSAGNSIYDGSAASMPFG